MSKLSFRLAARCEAAGRPNNEDNFQVASDLSFGKWQFTKDEVLPLGSKGALLLVCDGMGGMNAGEVASKIAVETMKSVFSKDSLENTKLESDEQRCGFIYHAIQKADANIKKESSADEAKRGMGSTIVLAWLMDGKVYVGWCGDSRAYKYNPKRGLVQLSHDHSYVQELVDAGQLSPELAFDHPNNNIITRSLGDPRGVAQPDVKCYSLEENDVILLCSDGLCGVLRDHEIGQLIANNLNSMNLCRDALWEAAKNAGWHDNVTIALAQIMPQQPQIPVSSTAVPKPVEKRKLFGKKYIKVCTGVLAVLIIVLVSVFGYYKYSKKQSENPCTQFEDLVKKYEALTNPVNDQEGIIDTVLYHIEDIRRCPELKEKVSQSSEKHSKTIECKTGKYKDDVLKKINEIQTYTNNQ